MTSCPTTQVLADFLAGVLMERELHTVESHVEVCVRCHETLDRLSDDTELRGWVGGGSSGAEVRSELGYAAMVREWNEATPDLVQPTSDTAMSGLTDLAPARVPGDIGSLDGYRIQAELGRGGMGIVFRAHDETLQRVVAVKVLRCDYGDRRTRQRFLREAQTAARVKHDHIVSVYAVGTPDNGPPYLAMEFVQGPSLREIIKKEARLDPRQAAEICAQVGDGLAVAHAAGLVHRDIKPSNILLERMEVLKPPFRAKITDFGLARITDVSNTLTQEGMLAGTPSYMSPEQVRDPDGIDQRSDIYSLGVTLFESLTGEVPFGGAPHMVLRQIEHDEPRRPCQLNDAVPRDLETICLKAMAKEPNHRYQTAAEVADDLRRWLRGEPILGRPVAAAERAWRWCRRKPLVTGLTAALALSFLIGLVGVFWQWRRAEANLVQALQHQRAAEKSDGQARQAVDQYYSELLGAGPVSMKALNELREKLLGRAIEYYQERAAPGNDQDAKVRAELAEAHARLAHVYQYMGKPEESLDEWMNAIAIREELVESLSDTTQCARELAFAYRAVARQLDALDRDNEGDAFLQKARDCAKRFLETYPNDTPLQIELAKAHCHIGLRQRTKGNVLGAIEAQQESLAIWESFEAADDYQRNERAKVYVNLGELLVPERPTESLFYIAKACSQWEELCHRTPHNQEYIFNLAVAYSDMGEAQRAIDRPMDAAEYFEKARRLNEQLLDEDRSLDATKQYLADCELSIGELERETGDHDAALASFERARRIEEKLLAFSVAKVPHQIRLGRVWDNLGLVHLECGRLADARDAFQRAIEFQRMPRSATPDSRKNLGKYYRHLARADRELGLPSAASTQLEQARQEYEAIARSNGGDKEAQLGLIDTYVELAEAHCIANQPDHAVRAIQQAIEHGLRNLERLRSNSVLAPLHANTDFLRLISELESASVAP